MNDLNSVLHVFNLRALADEAGIKKQKLADVRRGKSTLSRSEQKRIEKIITGCANRLRAAGDNETAIRALDSKLFYLSKLLNLDTKGSNEQKRIYDKIRRAVRNGNADNLRRRRRFSKGRRVVVIDVVSRCKQAADRISLS